MGKNFLVIAIACILLTGCVPFLGKLYTEQDIADKCGAGFKNTWDNTIAEIPCQRVTITPSSTDAHFNEMYFYLFDSAADAKKAFQKSSELFSDLEEEGSDYKKGWLANVCDASIEQYMYLSNNLIITVDTKCYSEWPEGMDTSFMCEPDLDAWRWEESYRQEVIDLMRATF